MANSNTAPIVKTGGSAVTSILMRGFERMTDKLIEDAEDHYNDFPVYPLYTCCPNCDGKIAYDVHGDLFCTVCGWEE
jgi:hypothetical protein